MSMRGTGSASGPLSGDSLAEDSKRSRSYSSTSITGYEDGPYTLSLLGVQTNKDGTLGLNSATLKSTF